MASRQRYQNGSLLKQRRADNRSEWILRYRVTLPDGRRVQRRAVIGTTEKYRTESQAQKAADQVRLTINSLSRPHRCQRWGWPRGTSKTWN